MDCEQQNREFDLKNNSLLKYFRWISQEMKTFFHEQFSRENIQQGIFPNYMVLNNKYTLLERI